jgi:hypothetical protein
VQYRCYFLNWDSHFESVKDLVCADDDAAELVARDLLDEQPKSFGAELWKAGRFVAKLDRRSENLGKKIPAG